MVENEVVENEAQENLQEINVRADLNDIVTLAKFEEVKSKYGVSHPFYVTFFNKEKMQFQDTEGIFDLLNSFKVSGLTGFIKSRKLVEEAKLNENGEVERTYFCYKFEIETEDKEILTYRLFPRYFSSNQVIKNYYNAYKKQKEAEANK